MPAPDTLTVPRQEYVLLFQLYLAVGNHCATGATEATLPRVRELSDALNLFYADQRAEAMGQKATWGS